MSNSYFQFKQFRIEQAKSGMKVTTDACIFGAWVAKQIGQMTMEPARVLDIGTGTGLLSLMLAQVTDQSTFDAIDLNQAAFDEAADNFKNSTRPDRLCCIHSSLQQYESKHLYDLIICNPPFFGKNQLGRDSHKNQALHNNDLSMADLSNGINRLLEQDGVAFVLYPEWEMKAFSKWMSRLGFFINDQLAIRNKKESSVFRFVNGFSRKETDIKKTELIIKDTNGNYTKSFQQLLHDYYLD